MKLRPAGTRFLISAMLCLSAKALPDGDPVRLITLDPGHFHAALFQKEMLPGVAPRVHIYAPAGPDLLAHLQRVLAFNSRPVNPTTWEYDVHASPDFMARLLAERPGNVVVISGSNQGKIGRIEALLQSGLHVLADKPWIIEAEELPGLEHALQLARRQQVVGYDAMTERHEISHVLQKELVLDSAVFGTILPGSMQEPAVFLESTHFLRKDVAGAPLIRSPSFFDVRQYGEPLADVGTHLVDLVQWTLSSERPLDYRQDIAVLRGSRTINQLELGQFTRVTALKEYPASLGKFIRGGKLDYLSQNSVNYTLRGIHVKLDVNWGFEAPPGGADTALAIFRGSRSRVELRLGPEEKFIPEVFVIPARAEDRPAVESALRARLHSLESRFPGLALETDGGRLHVVIPSSLRDGHEAHFARVVRDFLSYRANPDSLPAWEDAFMLAKYFVTTEGVRLGRQAGEAVKR